MNRFFIADTHFGHKNILGSERIEKFRPWDTVEEMDEALIENWNKVVKPKDKVYHLGDVAMSKKHIATIGRCNGRKVLVGGNHDNYNPDAYLPYFEKICGSIAFDKIIMTHIPVHESQFERFSHNVHGHLHQNIVYRKGYINSFFNTKPDFRYICVSVEQINYTPIAWDDLLLKTK